MIADPTDIKSQIKVVISIHTGTSQFSITIIFMRPKCNVLYNRYYELSDLHSTPTCTSTLVVQSLVSSRVSECLPDNIRSFLLPNRFTARMQKKDTQRPDNKPENLQIKRLKKIRIWHGY